MLANTICYKQKEPTYYNKDTKWEKTCDTFLLCYVYGTDEQAQQRCDEMNELLKTNPDKITKEHRVDATNIDYFFVNKQEEMY